MNKFRDAYREALKDFPQVHMDAGSMGDGLLQRRMLYQRSRRMVQRGCAAAILFLLCGAGAVAVKSYRNSEIQVEVNNYTVTGAQDSRMLSEEPGALPVVCAMGDSVPVEDGELEAAMAAEWDDLKVPEYASVETLLENLALRFRGFAEKIVEAVLDSFDLTVYDQK